MVRIEGNSVRRSFALLSMAYFTRQIKGHFVFHFRADSNPYHTQYSASTPAENWPPVPISSGGPTTREETEFSKHGRNYSQPASQSPKILYMLIRPDSFVLGENDNVLNQGGGDDDLIRRIVVEGGRLDGGTIRNIGREGNQPKFRHGEGQFHPVRGLHEIPTLFFSSNL